MDRDDEPVFIRSKWGTSRYVYNPRNPVGLALILISLLFAVVMLILMQERMGPFARPEPTPWSTVPAYEPWPASTYVPDTDPTPSAGESGTGDPSGP
ncbi:hypothetical protein GCM10010207_72530 [Streptomyces atratus]|uniref:hypothetical protein n=1 Tax=Streptomyces atratus TaxID=1893 RepID=UPI00167072A3|nr:hypothetical protein [Streptomyces atratus]GGT62532.1 hypothetical protein GCM10010207_72530 [Streptomyces atratus]